MLISEETKSNIYLLVQRFFTINRMLDRALSVFSVKFAMNNFVKNFHVPYAHTFPIFADKIGDILDRYNVEVEYLQTPTDNSDYVKPLDFFDRLLNFHIETVELFNQTIKVTTENGEMQVVADLNSILVKFNIFVSQAILLRDKSNIYGDNLYAFDHDSSDFYIVGNIEL